MGELTTKCAACGATLRFGQTLRGQRRACPKCGAVVTLEPGGAPDLPAAPAGPAGPASSGAAGGDVFPERMKANRALAGRACPGCGAEIELGDPVWNCQTCGATMHQACREQRAGCANPACSARASGGAGGAALAPAALGAAPGAEGGDLPGGGGLVDCRFCGEKIRRGARKCRFCGEFQRAGDRRRREQRTKSAESDDTLTGAEIVFGILCSGIACIVGLVWLIQGKKKGGKLLLIAIITSIIVTAIRLAAEGGP